MPTPTQKALLMRKWSARRHAFVCFKLLLGGLGVVALILLLRVLGLNIPLPTTWIMNTMAGLSLGASALRFVLVKRGWAAVSHHEVEHLRSYFVESKRSDLFVSEHMLTDEFGKDALTVCLAKGWISWADMLTLLKKYGLRSRDIEWFFLARGGEEPAPYTEWAKICSPHAVLDAQSSKAVGIAVPRRL